ncbi:hypothetical protein [Flavobacterium sp. PL02]|uniref:hypothetical protein n=1 Tax=Flavobacterium sp. PL02 TaxID=3088354 RepID=UPI002B22574E|nr:hypothetical protein [Flavobacterium sp. PL02]MEA9415611.1 hypothetical protein [Flavobacterium sp. PL02]
MAKLSKEEILNLKEGLNEVFIELENNNSAFNDFYNNPIEFFNRFKITSLNYLSNYNSLKDRLTFAIRDAIRDAIGQFGRIVSSCLICKTTVLLIIFGTLGKTAVLWEGVLASINFIKDGVKEYFELTSNEIDRIFNALDRRTNNITPSHLAFQICINLGHCQRRI